MVWLTLYGLYESKMVISMIKKLPEGAVNVPSFERADPIFNSTLLNGTIVFSILLVASILATNALN